MTDETDLNKNLPKVISLSGAVEQIKEKSAVKSKSKAPLYEEIARAIGREGAEILPAFPSRLHVVEHKRGEPVIYEEMSGQTLERRSLDFVAAQILKYVTRYTRRSRFLFDARDAKNCANYWLLYAQILDTEIFPVIQKTHIGYNFHRLPWDFVDGECPTWDEMFGRVENAQAIMAWVGSLFVAHSERQQYVWIYGEGGNGKGAINRFLKRVFNGAYKSESVPERGDKFWTSNLLNSRVVVFPDCNNYNFPTTGLFKQITGDDPIKVEFKGENAFSAELVCKLLFLSNRRPNISGQTSDTRRAIFGEIAPIVGDPMPTKMYDAMLWNEAPQFLQKCLNVYEELCPDSGVIPTDKEIIADLINDNEEALEMITLKNFEIFEENSRHKDEEKNFISPMEMDERLCMLKIRDDRRRSYVSFLSRRYGIRKVRVRIGPWDRGEREYRYINVKLKSIADDFEEDGK